MPAAPTIPSPPVVAVTPAKLTVLYDEACALCRRARDWLLEQPCLVEVELLPAGSQAARERYPHIDVIGEELVVVDERGNAWVGPPAFLACMWATARFRSWSFRLSRPRLAPLARGFFTWLSARRCRVGSDDSWCAQPSQPTVYATVCARGHAMEQSWRFCRACGAPRATG